MTTFRFTIATYSLLFAYPAVSAQTLPSDTSLSANPLFQENCAKCHGKNPEGRHFGGPSLNSEKTSATSAVTLRGIITNGKGRMQVCRQVDIGEIDTLVEQIKALNRK